VSRQVFKRCTRCAKRTRLGAGDRRCPACGSADYTWGFVVDIGDDPATGKRRRRRGGGFPTRKAAEVALREVLAKRDRGQLVQPTKMTVREFLVDQWLPAMRLSIGVTTLEGYRGNIERYIVPRVGDLPLRALTPPRINQLYADVREHGRTRGTGPLALKTVREVHVTLHRALEDAVRWDYLETNPSDRATAPSATAARNERRRRIRTWSAAEVNSFAAFIQGHELHELWALAASTGLRRSELLGLRWIDLDLHRRLLSVRRVLVKVGGTAQFKDAPKSAHGFRTISIPPRVTQLLTELREWQADQPLLRIVPPEQALVFCRPDGDPWHPTTCRRPCGSSCSRAASPHPAHAGPSPHARDAADRRRRRQRQGRPGTARPPLPLLHRRHLPARHPRNGRSRRRPVRLPRVRRRRGRVRSPPKPQDVSPAAVTTLVWRPLLEAARATLLARSLRRTPSRLIE
jgi:integrase